MNQLRLSILAGVTLIALACSTAQAQVRVIVAPQQPGIVNSPYYLPFGYTYNFPNYTYFPNYLQPIPQASIPVQTYVPPPLYIAPDPYYPYYYPAQPIYVPQRGVRSNWKLDNMRPIGAPRR